MTPCRVMMALKTARRNLTMHSRCWKTSWILWPPSGTKTGEPRAICSGTCWCDVYSREDPATPGTCMCEHVIDREIKSAPSSVEKCHVGGECATVWPLVGRGQFVSEPIKYGSHQSSGALCTKQILQGCLSPYTMRILRNDVRFSKIPGTV